MERTTIEKEYPIFYKTTMYLEDKANFFRNSLPKLLDSNYDYGFAERICKTGLEASSNDWEEYLNHVDNLIKLSSDFLRFQLLLEKNGRYQHSSFKEVEKIYILNSEEGYGPDYLWGLYFSEVFWKIHCNLTKFFFNNFVVKVQNEGIVLEVPVGTGFYLSEFLLRNSNWNGIGIDLADNAVNFSKEICRLNKIDNKIYQIIKSDFLMYDDKLRFDRIICGEFLEHVEDPLKILKKLHELLKDEGKVFLTTAIWSGGIDHIYLYKHPQEVRTHIIDAGFKIEDELVQTVFEKDENNPEKGMIPINYSAILSKTKFI